MSTQDELKLVAKKFYPLMREIYNYHAGIGTIGNLFAIPLNQYSNFVNEVELIDSDFKVSDADRMFIAVNAPKETRKASANNPQHALVRCEFLEIVIRIAIVKYFESKLCKSEAEALDRIITDHISKKYNYQKVCQSIYRRNVFWNEPLDNVLKAFKPVFLHLFKNFGGTTKKPGEPTFMVASEF